MVHGVERMLFVEALFVFVLIAFIWLLVTLIMFKKLNKTRITGVMLILLAFIAVGAVIFVVGHFTSQEFAIGAFHSNIGWIAFTLYFLVFIYFTYDWMKR